MKNKENTDKNMIESKAALFIGDKELVKQAKLDDKDVFKKIFLKHKNLVFRIAYKMLNDIHKAEDVTEDTFFYLITNIDQFREESSLSTYLCSIAINKCRNILRESGRELDIEDITKLKCGDFNLPESILESKEATKLVRETLDELPGYREILILADSEDLSYDEIGKILKISRMQVKDRLYRARIAFRKKWSDKKYEM